MLQVSVLSEDICNRQTALFDIIYIYMNDGRGKFFL